jgi:hypothetical protein
MSLDVSLWEALEQRGVCQAHLELLLRLLELNRNGSLSWHFVHGCLQQVDTRLVVQSRRVDLMQVCAAIEASGRQEL